VKAASYFAAAFAISFSAIRFFSISGVIRSSPGF
jgi:hypothetical protein